MIGSSFIYFSVTLLPKMNRDGSKEDTDPRLNPYAYQREIENVADFVDREEVRGEIRYYLEQASLGEFYNVAITGETSIGKTSLLNMIQYDAEDIDILPVKVPLDRMNTVSELEFFRELYEIIMSAGVEQDQIDQSILDRFRDIVNGVDIDAEASIGYSSTYIKLKESGDQMSSVPRREIVDDFSDLFDDELGSTAVVLLVDDAEVFSNDDLFRKFESIVSSLDGYQMILAGTNLVNVLPDEYVPLRQSFVLFELEPFSEIEHTRKCLLNPLTEEEDDFEADVGEIHAVSGGSPFEIRLIAHHMYRRYAETGEGLSLTREVLDEVAESLLSTNPSREIADQIKQLSSDYLLAVVAAVEFPKTPLEWLAKCMFLYEIEDLPDSVSSVEKRRKQIIEQLVSSNILSEDDGLIEFNGTWFDQMYLKYHAAALGVIDEDYNFSPGDEDHLASNIHDKLVTQRLLDDIGETRGTTRFDMEYDPDKPEGEKHHILTKQFVTELTVSADEWTVVDVISPDRREEFYQQVPNAIWFRCNIEWMDYGFLTQIVFRDDVEDQEDELEDRIEELSEKLEPLGYQLLLENEMTWFHRGLEGLKRNHLKALECFEKSLGYNPMFGRAWDRRGVVLQSLDRYTEALVSYELALDLDPAVMSTRVNKATIFADQGLHRKAASILEEVTEDDPDYTSAWLRLGRVRAEMGDLEGSNEALEEAL